MRAHRHADFERLFRDHFEAVTRFCRRRLPIDDADSATAEVFTTAWVRFDQLTEGDGLVWLYAIARHKIAHQHRARGRRSALDARLGSNFRSASIADVAEVLADDDILKRAAIQLSDEDRELLELVSWEGLGPSELATVLGCTTNAASIRVHRMRQRFERLIEAADTLGADQGQKDAQLAGNLSGVWPTTKLQRKQN